MLYKVKDVVELAGVTARQLHHYDRIGLLSPEQKTDAGYRLYSTDDLDRLQQILLYRELDFSLQEIQRILDDEAFGKQLALHQHRELLIKKRERLDRIIHAVEQSLCDESEGPQMSDKEKFEAFDQTEIEQLKEKYAEETRERWGNTDAYKQSFERTSKYSPEDWTRIQTEGAEIFMALGKVMDKDVSDEDVQTLIERYRSYITEHFYDCTLEIFSGLGAMYVADPRFTRNINKYGEGLASFMQKAIAYYCKQGNAR